MNTTFSAKLVMRSHLSSKYCSHCKVFTSEVVAEVLTDFLPSKFLCSRGHRLTYAVTSSYTDDVDALCCLEMERRILDVELVTVW